MCMPDEWVNLFPHWISNCSIFNNWFSITHSTWMDQIRMWTNVGKFGVWRTCLLSLFRGGISKRPLPVPDLTPGLTLRGRRMNSRPLYSSMTRSARSLLAKSTKQYEGLRPVIGSTDTVKSRSQHLHIETNTKVENSLLIVWMPSAMSLKSDSTSWTVAYKVSVTQSFSVIEGALWKD